MQVGNNLCNYITCRQDDDYDDDYDDSDDDDVTTNSILLWYMVYLINIY